MQAVKLVSDMLGVMLPLRSMFDKPTIAEHAMLIHNVIHRKAKKY